MLLADCRNEGSNFGSKFRTAESMVDVTLRPREADLSPLPNMGQGA